MVPINRVAAKEHYINNREALCKSSAFALQIAIVKNHSNDVPALVNADRLPGQPFCTRDMLREAEKGIPKVTRVGGINWKSPGRCLHLGDPCDGACEAYGGLE